MTEEKIKSLLQQDLRVLGVDTTGFELVLKPYSKTYYGRYVPSKKRVIVYLYEDSDFRNQYPYEDIFSTVLHEVVHHIQWSDPNFKRIKGVMHNSEFYSIYNNLMRRHKIFRVVNGGDKSVSNHKESRH